MYEIIIGRGEDEKKKFGRKGTILLGKLYVKMGQTTSLSNPIYMDVTRPHVVFICGKRGGGKSYTMGVLCEGMSSLPEEIKDNLAIVILDTMGIYWTMKYANQRDEELLKEWGLKGKGLDVKIYTPKGFYNEFKDKGIPTDKPFALKPSELSPEDWCLTFDVSSNEPIGIAIERVILELKESGKEFGIDDIIETAKAHDSIKQDVKDALENRFLTAKRWGVFSKHGTPLSDIVKKGQVTVLDVSCYATMPGGWKIKSLVIGIVSQNLFLQRMIARRNEEYQAIHKSLNYFGDEDNDKSDKEPMVWLIIDEAHEFMPKEGKTAATDALVTILREGRQPGISLVLASQQPGKIHTDVMTQLDILLSHRITARIDTEALGALMQSYMRHGLDRFLNDLPRVRGSAIILDDANERIFPMRVRPRITWHGGESASAMPNKHKEEDYDDILKPKDENEEPKKE